MLESGGGWAAATRPVDKHKHGDGPLFPRRGQGTTYPRAAYERDINNGYSSVLRDPDGGGYQVFYVVSGDFHGAIPGESAGSAMLVAASDDGVVFRRPTLGRVAWQNSTANNILWDGTTAVGVYDDAWHERNASRRFKAWGNLAGLDDGPRERERDRLGYTAQLAGTAVSKDGLTWTDYARVQNPSSSKSVKGTLRFDATASLYYDPRLERYVGSDRAFRPCPACGECPIWWQPQGGCQADLGPTCTAAQCNQTVRAIGASLSSSSDFASAAWGANKEVHADHANPTQQLYSQVSWPFYNVYLGIVSVFHAGDPHDTWGKGKVHCELAWSRDGATYAKSRAMLVTCSRAQRPGGWVGMPWP